MSQLFDLKKVVDPHKHMPEDIKDLFFEAFRDEARGNDSYINYSVGEYVKSLKPGDEDDKWYSSERAEFDKWALENFEDGEDLVLLYWW